MAAELYPPASPSAATATDIANSNAAGAAESTKVGLCCPPCLAPAPLPPLPAPPLPDNNNPESPNWQSFHPTLRESMSWLSAAPSSMPCSTGILRK
uniref:BTB domain containing 6 n=1 Tax=Mus musculus TaxID=10090 RepID=A0A1Y7VJT6_MOUSE